ncbi:MAG TPA: TonB-dependent receptor plug domain-containing protein, partial [Nevskiaceae bacterium]|nr:TonB-dependent receptor plug domain-containing protein [Nevskiaceae bacterium]
MKKNKTGPRLPTFRARLSPLTVAMITLFAAVPMGATRAEPTPEPSTSPAAAAPGAAGDPGEPKPAEAATDDEIVVTATRRKTTIQDIPLNVSAVTGESIAAQGLEDLADLTRTTPGLFYVDQGGRDTNLLTVRGLNADSLTA